MTEIMTEKLTGNFFLWLRRLFFSGTIWKQDGQIKNGLLQPPLKKRFQHGDDRRFFDFWRGNRLFTGFRPISDHILYMELKIGVS